jgi:hypothetical protein
VFSPEVDFILYKVFATVVSRQPRTTFPAFSLVLEMHALSTERSGGPDASIYGPAGVRLVGDTNVIESARYYCRFCAVLWNLNGRWRNSRGCFKSGVN